MPCRVRMYAAFCHERRYIGRMLTSRAYIFEHKSGQVKSAKYLLMAEMVSRNRASRNSKADARKYEKSHGLEQSRTEQKSR